MFKVKILIYISFMFNNETSATRLKEGNDNNENNNYNNNNDKNDNYNNDYR